MYQFEKITERDVDMIIMRSFVGIPELAEMFLSCVGWSKAKIICVEHSLYDSQLGESDVTVIVESKGELYALLIENKIDAKAMPEQCDRYIERGKRGKENGEYSDYAVFIVAPRKYLETNSEAKKYPNKISYEAILELFTNKKMDFECEVIRGAIEKKEAGYTVREVKSITDFWGKLYDYIQKSQFSVEMNKPNGVKGSRSNWVYFRVPLNGTYLAFKSDKGFVDWEFSGKLSERKMIQDDLNLYKDDNMHWYPTGGSLSLRMVVKPIDFKKPFEHYIDDINMMLFAVEKITALAIKLNDIGYTV